MVNEIKYPAARIKKIIHHAPQFRPIKRGARRKGIERQYIAKNGDILTIAMFHELDIADQDVLLCLLAIARAEDRGVCVNGIPETDIGRILRDSLELGGVVENATTLMVKTTGYEILTELGKTVGTSGYKWLEKSLTRLSRVSFKYQNSHGFSSFNLLSVSGWYGLKGEVKKISICINPLSAQAVFGDDGGYVLVNRSERRELEIIAKSEKDEVIDLAKALHFVLCGLVDMGAERFLSVDMLADKVYSRYDEVITDGAARGRRMKILNICDEINKLSYWTCKATGRGKATTLHVTRKRRKEVKRP